MKKEYICKHVLNKLHYADNKGYKRTRIDNY